MLFWWVITNPTPPYERKSGAPSVDVGAADYSYGCHWWPSSFYHILWGSQSLLHLHTLPILATTCYSQPQQSDPGHFSGSLPSLRLPGRRTYGCIYELFCPFILAASRLQPKVSHAPLPSPALYGHCYPPKNPQGDLPGSMEGVKDKWMEPNADMLQKLTKFMQKHPVNTESLYISPSATCKWYPLTLEFRNICRRWSFAGTCHMTLLFSDLRLLFNTLIHSDFCTDEADARHAAHINWVLLQPFLVTSDLINIIHNTVVATKVEEKQPFSLPWSAGHKRH